MQRSTKSLISLWEILEYYEEIKLERDALNLLAFSKQGIICDSTKDKIASWLTGCEHLCGLLKTPLKVLELFE